MASLIFLGTAGDSLSVAKQTRNSCGIVLKTNNVQIAIDPGPGFLYHLSKNKINPRATNIVLVSHSHINHAGELNALVSAMSINGFDKNGILVCPKSVLYGNNKTDPLLTNFHKNCLEQIKTAVPGNMINFKDIKIQTAKAVHNDIDAVGYKIFTPKFSLAYLGDTEYYKDMKYEYKDIDILIINLQNYEKKQKGRMNLESAIKTAQIIKPNIIIITHFNNRLIEHNPLELSRKIQQSTKITTIAAKDYMAIDPEIYALGQRQKRLNFY